VSGGIPNKKSCITPGSSDSGEGHRLQKGSRKKRNLASLTQGQGRKKKNEKGEAFGSEKEASVKTSIP